ncbi:hypothetical protein [Aliamphritea spongicola]|uniref:hypothetical protein n=1 Tax=Aliamphritea spongicola TaxID=707589 RepID=UPI00196B183D|nr:hypothetical protein [Aliamphritea spongicola]MBN3560807.1 hypothetical protein [Aliamphritea spongicola]
METLLNNPLIQSSLLPLLLSLALTAAIGFSCDAGKKIAAVSIAASLLISIIQIQGFSAMPRSASQKLPYLIMIAGFAGLLIDTLNTRSRMLQTMSVIMPVTVLAWLFGGRISSIDAPGWGYFAAIILAAVVARRQCAASNAGINGAVKLLFVSIGLGAVTIIGASALIGQTAFALSAAIGGFLLLNWPKQRFTFGATAQLVIITVLTALLAQALFFTKASGIALLLLLPLLFTDSIQQKITFIRSYNSPAARPVCLSILAAALLPLAIGSAVLLAEPAGMAY